MTEDELKAENDELNALFDLRWKADIRAIKRWREANPGNDLVVPDHADLVVWLLERLDNGAQQTLQEQAKESLKEIAENCIHFSEIDVIDEDWRKRRAAAALEDKG